LANRLLVSCIEMRVMSRLAPLVACALAACSAATVQRPGVTVYESHTDSAMTEGETAIDCDPDAAFKAALDYARWPHIFDDIRSAVITSIDGNDARVTFVHTDGNRDNLHFHNRPAAHTLWFEDTGDAHARVWAEIAFLPGPRPGTTRVHSRLYADVTGIASLFVTSGHLRQIREQRVQHDLVQLHAYFSQALARAR
jgi:hypothetical protein